MDLRRLAGVLLALIVYAVVRSAGCKVSVTTKDGVAKITRGDPGSLRLMDRIGMDFLNGSVLPGLEQRIRSLFFSVRYFQAAENVVYKEHV